MSFVRLASDVSGLPKAPDIEFTIEKPTLMTAEVDGFGLRIELTTGDSSEVELSLNGLPFARTTHHHVAAPGEFAEEDYTEEVSGFACCLLWGAWRRREANLQEGATNE